MEKRKFENSKIFINKIFKMCFWQMSPKVRLPPLEKWIFFNLWKALDLPQVMLWDPELKLRFGEISFKRHFWDFCPKNALIITYGQTWPKYSLGNANSPKKISARSDHFWAKNMPQHAHRCSKNFLHFEFLFTYVRYWLIPIGYSVPLKMRRKKFFH